MGDENVEVEISAWYCRGH